jgi:hypothetical protein
MRRFKALCNDNYSLCYDDHHLYEEWEEVFRARPKYISIMSGLVTEEEEREMNGKENHVNDGLDEGCSQEFFLAYHQLVVYHCWLSFCLDEAALFQRFEVTQFLCLV